MKEIGSDLYDRSASMSLSDLTRKMNISEGPDEYLKPKNIGLLLFNDNPAAFFPCAQIDVVEFKNSAGDKFTEKIFRGPIQQQLKDVLIYLKNNILQEIVAKIPGQAESTRHFNYPFEAIEEALVNTVFHRGYQEDSPIEIRIYPEKIQMLSFPGPLPPLNKEKLLTKNIVARKYRNRRIGDFLKELHLAEGRGTGIPKIIASMLKNESPEPIFETDDNLSYFLAILPIHSAFLADQVTDQVGRDLVSREIAVLEHCMRPKKRREILLKLGLTNRWEHFEKYVRPLLEKGWLIPTIPDKPTSSNQQYRTTPAGEQALGELRK